MEILIALVSLLLGWILAILKDLFNNHLSKRERARYLALRVVYVLEMFIDDCLRVAKDDGLLNGPDWQGCLNFQTSYAKIDFQSLDVDWKSLSFDLTYEIINFPSKVEAAIDIIENAAEFGDGPPHYEEETEERRLQHARLGLLADELSTRLRAKYNIPNKERDVTKSFDKLIDEVEKFRAKRLERQAELNRQLSQK